MQAAFHGRKNMKKTIAVTVALMMLATPALAQGISGNWQTQSGETAAISKCGGSYCIVLKTGAHAGKQIGRVSGNGPKYTGKITDPTNDKTYSGSATVNGSTMKMTGCVAKVLCRSQTWKKM
jgi:uncharacterized protein (DUF2147 family)